MCENSMREESRKEHNMKQFLLGTIVTNFGQQATVVGYHNEDLILEDSDGLRWIADPEKCEEVVG